MSYRKQFEKETNFGESGCGCDFTEWLESRLKEAEKVIEFYANPDTYFGIAFFVDEPAGDFKDDASECGELKIPRPGKKARDFLRNNRR